MTTSEFWDLYSTKDQLGQFELTCELFSEDLPEGFSEESDVGELVIETRSREESDKNFDNVLKFTAIVRENHPDLYQEVYEYFDDFLVDYYCYHGEEDMLNEAFANFQAHPLQSLDQYLLAFNKLVYYQHTEIIQNVVSENFTKINEWEDSFGGPEFDLASFVYGETLEKLYLDQPDEFDRDEFSNKLLNFNYEFKEYNLDSIYKGLFHPQLKPDVLIVLFRKEKRKALQLLEVYFLRHMYKKGFKFYLSGDIWNHMLGYWMKDNNHDDTSSYSYFGSTTSSFEDYLFNQVSNSWIDNTPEIIEVLWGSVYAYEFLHHLELITQDTFDHFLTISRKLKGQMIGFYTDQLWNANFIHDWEKPDCISETEFKEEEKIFRKSIDFTYHDSRNLLELIPDELSCIGPLANDIKEAVADDERRRNKIKKDFSKGGLFSEFPDDKPFVRTEKKVGRNEPCPCGSGNKYKKCCGSK